MIDRVLDRGIVVDPWARASLAGIDLFGADLRVVVASVDAPGGEPAPAGRPVAQAVPPAPALLPESLALPAPAGASTGPVGRRRRRSGD